MGPPRVPPFTGTPGKLYQPLTALPTGQLADPVKDVKTCSVEAPICKQYGSINLCEVALQLGGWGFTMFSIALIKKLEAKFFCGFG